MVNHKSGRRLWFRGIVFIKCELMWRKTKMMLLKGYQTIEAIIND